MVFDRTGSFDPRNERKEIAKTQEEITSALNRIARNTELGRDDEVVRSEGRFKDQAVRSNAAMQYFKPKEDEKQDEFKASSRAESTFTKIVNFRDGLVIPIQDYFDYLHKEKMEFDTMLHREKIFQLRMIDRKVQELIPQGNKTLGQRMREGFNDFLRAPIINSFRFIGKNILMPVFSKIGSSFYNVFKDTLFGLGKAERTTVKAIDEQTQFLRKGFIDRDRGLWDRLREGGILGTLRNSRSEKMAQTAEQKKSIGLGVSKKEEKALKKQGENINLLARNAAKNKDNNIQERRNAILMSIFKMNDLGMKTQIKALGAINQTLSSIRNFLDFGLKSIKNNIAFFREDIRNVLVTGIVQSLNELFAFQVKSRAIDKASNENERAFIMEREFSNLKQREFAQAKALNENNDIQRSIASRMDEEYDRREDESTWMSPFEDEMTQNSKRQNQILSNMLHNIEKSNEPEQVSSSSGVLGSIGLGVGWIGKKIGGWLKSGLVAAGPAIMKLLKSGILKSFGAYAGVAAIGWTIGQMIGNMINKGINYLDETFNTSIGHYIGKFSFYVVDGLSKAWESIKLGVTILRDNAVSIVKTPFIKMWEGIKSVTDWMVDKVKDLPLVGRLFDDDDEKESKESKNTPPTRSRGGMRASGGGPPLPRERSSGMRSSGGGPPLPRDRGNVDEMNQSVQSTSNQTNKQMQEQTREFKALRERMIEQSQETNKLLQQINGNSAATAANSGGNTEEKVYLRKDQQFKFDGEPL